MMERSGEKSPGLFLFTKLETVAIFTGMSLEKEIELFYAKHKVFAHPHRTSNHLNGFIQKLARKYRLKLIGRGSGRIVLAVDDRTVLKLARNKPGQEQNLFESSFYQEQKNPVLNQVLDCASNGCWLKARRAKHLDDSCWKQLSEEIKLSPTQIGDSIGELFSKGSIHPSKLTGDVMDRFLASDFGRNLSQLVETDLDCDDLCEFGSEQYGTVDEKPVIVDYGLSKEIGYKYYYDYN